MPIACRTRRDAPVTLAHIMRRCICTIDVSGPIPLLFLMRIEPQLMRTHTFVSYPCLLFL